MRKRGRGRQSDRETEREGGVDRDREGGRDIQRLRLRERETHRQTRGWEGP